MSTRPRRRCCQTSSRASRRHPPPACPASTRTWCAAAARPQLPPAPAPHAASPCSHRLQDQPFCSTTGFKREVKCVYKTTVADNASMASTGVVVPREPYLAFQGCSPEHTNSFAAVVRFEVRSRVLRRAHALMRSSTLTEPRPAPPYAAVDNGAALRHLLLLRDEEEEQAASDPAP